MGRLKPSHFSFSPSILHFGAFFSFFILHFSFCWRFVIDEIFVFAFTSRFVIWR